jgi:hypothetical protein
MRKKKKKLISNNEFVYKVVHNFVILSDLILNFNYSFVC